MSDADVQFDVVVVGGTPGGIAAALSAGRAGRKVLLIESHKRIGGMSASGLGKSDVETRHLIGGLFQEFTDRVRRRYLDRYGEDSPDFKLCRDGYYFEPSVAEAVFNEMLDECSNVVVLTQHRLIQADVSRNVLMRIEIADCSEHEPTALAAGLGCSSDSGEFRNRLPARSNTGQGKNHSAPATTIEPPGAETAQLFATLESHLTAYDSNSPESDSPIGGNHKQRAKPLLCADLTHRCRVEHIGAADGRITLPVFFCRPHGCLGVGLGKSVTDAGR